MSKQEVRDEMKSTEGDPHLKGRIRRVQRELAARRMMADVPTATVVVTNPTHYAVALRYEDEERSQRSAPRVVAKGVDHLAQRIKELARESGVPLYEDVPLARALHAQCELGDQVPVDLYEAVAGVLAYVYRVQGEVVARRASQGTGAGTESGTRSAAPVAATA
jgi:flagellar biosynthetic protein FlhB